MSSSRLAQIPIDHVVAEVAAFPLTSEAALRGRALELSPFSGDGADLWREAESHVLGHFPGFSVDEVVAIRDRVWFGGMKRSLQPVPLATYLGTLADLFFKVEGDVAVPRLPDEDDLRRAGVALPGPLEAHARYAWRWLSFALPPDLLLAAFEQIPLPGTVRLMSASLDQLLRDRGYAETHVHLGCTLDFPLLWVITLRALADAHTTTDTFRSPGGCLREGRDLAPWLISAALARYLLAAYLTWGRQAGEFNRFLATTVRERLAREVGPTGYSLLLLCLSELLRGKLASDASTFADRQGLYALLSGVTTRKTGAYPYGAHTADPIAPFFAQAGPGCPTAEMRLVAESLRYLRANPAGKKDQMFAVLFWQAVRVRGLFYRHIVQRPMTPGLQWFIRFYGRMKAVGRTASKGLLFRSAAERGGAGLGLKSLEVRTSPDPARSKLYGEVLTIDEAARVDGARTDCPPPFEYGLVFHFSRDRGGEALTGKPTPHALYSHGDPSFRVDQKPFGNPMGYRYSQFYQEKRKEALALAWLLRHYPLALEVVRGLDLCTDELGVPTWVFVPLLRYVQEAGASASAFLSRACGRAVPPLRLTVHAGEDFVHLLTGLRHIDEVGRYFDLRQGSRIGHGLALGVDPRGWAHRAGRIPVIREERLFDLAWEWAWYGREEVTSHGGRRQLVDREIARLAEDIFKESLRPTPYELDRLMRDLHDPEVLRYVGFPTGPIPTRKLPDRLELLMAYLTNPEVFRRGRQIEWIDPSTEGEVLAGLQADIRRKYGEYGIAVEVNPTSNLLIGDLQDLANHPLWRLRPPRAGGDAPPVSVCIGSDDPLTFATNLREEYQFLHDALTLAGLSDEEARHWLNRTRESGLENRFTLRRPSAVDLNELRSLAEPLIPLPP